ncbi:zonular occludens toxin domain-containing protein [Paenibacillus kribbensis]|uniref:zonular occludens toxin domain-containing protein n=1 Tax=Paenibacillus kribbensis TaxID=172713 RepID=UPI0009FDEBB2|nr:zonular occludens toxin domain-containing protein [Paenibacillus kribbensis]
MPHIIGVMGNLGVGKTTMASLMAWLYKIMIEKAGGSAELFANYELEGAQRMKVAEDWFKVAEAHGSICVWDEAHRSFNSRTALKSDNIIATDILTFARKMASVQIFATPSVNRLDSRVREMLEVLLHIRPAGNKGMHIDYYDFQADSYGRLGKLIHSRFLSAAKVKQIHALNLFDSHSFVGGFPLPRTEREAAAFMDKLEQVHDEARRNKHANNRTSKQDQARSAGAAIPFPIDPAGSLH